MSVFSRLFNPLNRLQKRALFNVWVEVIVYDVKGNVIERKRKKCRSYIYIMVNLLNIQMSQANREAGKDTGGTLRTVSPQSTVYQSNAGAGDTTFGIVVGTGTGAVQIEQYCLEALIAHGTGAGQLQYGAMSVGLPTTVGSSRRFTLARTLTNNSGANITVNEVGLYTSHSTNRFMIERSLLTFSIGNGLSATVTYTIQVTV